MAVLASVGLTAAAAQPNVVFILSDDQGWTDYGFMGYPHIQTPNLDRLANAGMLYERGYGTAPLCRPSLASLTTGLYPHQTRIWGNDPVMPTGTSRNTNSDLWASMHLKGTYRDDWYKHTNGDGYSLNLRSLSTPGVFEEKAN